MRAFFKEKNTSVEAPDDGVSYFAWATFMGAELYENGWSATAKQAGYDGAVSVIRSGEAACMFVVPAETWRSS
jgi:hypothetical protein